jgi:predicted nucleic acid-binding protein
VTQSSLAGELSADQLIVDDRQGRHEAEKRGIPVMGTVGVLREAAILGLLDLRAAVKRLEATSFHIVPEVLARLLKDRS